MASLPVVGSQGGVPQSANLLEKTRAELHQYAQGLLIASVVLLISFWSCYIFPFALMVGAICTGLLQYTHTKDYDTMLTDSTIAGPSQVFRYLHMMNIVGVIGGAICQVLSVVALIVNATGSLPFNTVQFIFQAVAFGACATITALAWVGQVKCKEVDLQVVAILTGGIPSPTQFVSSASAPLNPGYGGGYGSTTQQPPAQSYGAPAAYGGQSAPVTGTPLAFSEKPAPQ